jgi:hypothetical protein
MLIDDLRVQGDTQGKRLAFELMQEMGCCPFSDTQVVEVVLAYDGLTMLPWPRQSDEGLTVRFSRFADCVPIDRLDGILDTLTAYLRELLPERAGIQEHDLITLPYRLILRRLETGFVNPLKLWAWLSLYLDYKSKDEKTVAEWIEANDDVRRAIHRSVILDNSEKPIWWKVSRLTRVSSGLAVNERDAVALLRELDPADRADTRWRDLLLLVPHDNQRGAEARNAAMPFVAHDPQLQDWLGRLANPSEPNWKITHHAKERQRAAKRATKIAENRRYFVANLKNIRAGEVKYVHPLARAYFGLFGDLNADCEAHERVAEWLGEDVAEAAHRGFEAFITSRPVRPSAQRIAVSLANNKRWNACDIIVAAFAERVRTRAEPFVDLSTERLMAGVFELWNSNIHEHAGLPNLRERIESELRGRGAWEAALRLYLAPQLKRGLPDSGFLFCLMTSEVDAPHAAALAADWLRSCPELLAEAEEKMIDRLMRSPRRAELCKIGDMRRSSVAGNDKRRRNWDAVQVLVDFEAASDRLRETVEPDLLWHLRTVAENSRADHPAPIKMRPSQLTWIVATFRKSWSAQYRPSGVTWGTENRWEASEYLWGLISRLGEDTSDDAVAGIEALRDAPPDGYTDHIRVVAAEQHQKRIEKVYTSPTLQQIISILNAGPPTNSADLQAVMMDALETAQRWLRGNDVDWYRGFFREDGRHNAEELCRDEIIKMLRAIDNSLEYTPEAHTADDKRVDIVARAHERLILPIEIKGQWHPELWTAADKQLDHLYLNDWRAERGIYLVLWFGKEDVRLPPDGRPKPITAQELREALSETSNTVLAGQVDVVVLDLTRPGTHAD